MNMSKTFGALVLISLNLFFAGCATTPPRDTEMHELGKQTFGTDAYLKVVWIPYAGPLSDALSSGLGNTSDELAVADAMLAAKSQKADLVVWSDSSSKTASTILRALRNPSLQSGLEQLQLLFVGNAQDADRVRPAVEATGAKFYFHQM